MGYLSLVASLMLIVALVGGCGGDDDDDSAAEPAAAPATSSATDAVMAGPTATAGPAATEPPRMVAPGPEAEAALAAVESFDPAQPGLSIERLNAALFPEGALTTDNVVALLAPMLVDDQPERRWAALYAVALAADTPQEIEALMAMLSDPEPVFRVHAAGSLARLGVLEALPALIDGLELEGDMPYSDPPLPIANHARTTLEHYTGQLFPDVAGWQEWWARVGASLTWDGARFVAG